MAELTLTGMRVVYEVGVRGSFTAAAGALGYTQSAVSRQVSLAEQAVGAKLFERGSRGVRPTQRGELLLRRVKAILAQVDAAMLEQDERGGAIERAAHCRGVPDGARRARATGARPGYR